MKDFIRDVCAAPAAEDMQIGALSDAADKCIL